MEGGMRWAVIGSVAGVFIFQLLSGISFVAALPMYVGGILAGVLGTWLSKKLQRAPSGKDQVT
jgi:LytS/YehU family sensor histidine kinase